MSWSVARVSPGPPLARAHRASRHRLRGSHYGLRSFMLPMTASTPDDPRRRGEWHGRRAGALAAQRHRLERSRRLAPPCTVPGRTAVAANDSGSAALPACAGVAAGAIWSARTMTPPPATPAPTRPAPTPDSRCCRGRTLRLSRPKPWGPPPADSVLRGPPTHDARSVGAVKAYPSSVGVTVVRAVRSFA